MHSTTELESFLEMNLFLRVHSRRETYRRSLFIEASRFGVQTKSITVVERTILFHSAQTPMRMEGPLAWALKVSWDEATCQRLRIAQ